MILSERGFRRRFEALFEGSTTPAQLYDARGRLLFSNSAWFHLNPAVTQQGQLSESSNYNLLEDPRAATDGMAAAFRRALKVPKSEPLHGNPKAKHPHPAVSARGRHYTFLPVPGEQGEVSEVLILSRETTGTLAGPGSPDRTFERAKKIADDAPVAIQIYNAQGFTIYSNEHHSRIFGGPPPPGYCVLEDSLIAESGNLHLIKDAFSGNTARLPLLWYDARDLKDLAEADQAYTRTHGKKCAIETHMIPVLDEAGQVSHVFFIFKDVTGELYMRQEREVAIKERDDTKKLIQDILDQTSAVISIKDQSGKLIFANKQFEKISGRSLPDLLGKTDQELFPQELAEIYQRNDRRVAESGLPLEIEETAIHADGVQHTYLASKFPLEDSLGKAYGICGISTDITRFRQMENELNNAKRIESVGLLSGGVAHNFNNILGVILLVADTILMRKLARTRELKTAIGTIRTATQNAAHLTQQLLTFGRRQRSEPRNIDLGEVVRNTHAILKSALSEDIRFSVELAPAVWPVHADPTQIEQILTNLCLNARDAMPRGGKLRVSVRNLTVPPEGTNTRIGRISGDHVELAVSDTGEGISSENLDRIFEPFFTTKRDGQGTGLGLATVYGAVQAANGGLSVETLSGKGTTFRIYFPKAIAGAPAPAATRPKRTGKRRGTETLLLIEDQPSLREVTVDLLRECGYRVIVARDGKEALRLWRKASRKPHLIITDIVMPGGSGLEVLKNLEKEKSKRPIRALIVSAYTGTKLSNYDFEQDRYQFIEKPYTAEELLTRVRSALRARGGRTLQKGPRGL